MYWRFFVCCCVWVECVCLVFWFFFLSMRKNAMGKEDGWKSLFHLPPTPSVKPAGKCSPAAAASEQKRAGAAWGDAALPAGSLCRGHLATGTVVKQGGRWKRGGRRRPRSLRAPRLHCSWGLANFVEKALCAPANCCGMPELGQVTPLAVLGLERQRLLLLVLGLPNRKTFTPLFCLYVKRYLI